MEKKRRLLITNESYGDAWCGNCGRSIDRKSMYIIDASNTSHCTLACAITHDASLELIESDDDRIQT